MSTKSNPSNFPNITLKVPKIKKNKSNNSFAGATPTHPFSTCGPLQYDNEFFQFYAQLYKSAVIYSNPKFQQSLLFPGGYVNVSGRNYSAQNFDRSPGQSSTPVNKRHIKKAQRRLSGASESNNKPSSCSTDNEPSSSGGGSVGGSLKHLQSDFEIFYKSIATTSTPALSPQENKNTKGKKEFKRRVSFSKASPRVRSRSNSNNGKIIPKTTVEEHCWSSDMDETDTTESESDENASSTLGEGEDNGFILAQVVAGSIKENEVKVQNDSQELLAKFNELSTDDPTADNAKNDLNKKPEFDDDDA